MHDVQTTDYRPEDPEIMSESAKRPREPSWAPRRVLDVDAQEADRPLVERLHAATAAAVEPIFMSRVESLAGEVVAADLTRQAEGLRAFMLSEQRQGLSPTQSSALREAVVPFIEDRLQTDTSTANAERTLAAQLSAEFAGSMWATLLSRLSKKYGGGGGKVVPPHELLPHDLLTGTTPLLQQVADDARHFGLTPEELNKVMVDTLARLTSLGMFESEDKYIQLPLGLRVETMAISDRILHLRQLASAASNAASAAEIAYAISQQRMGS